MQGSLGWKLRCASRVPHRKIALSDSALSIKRDCLGHWGGPISVVLVTIDICLIVNAGEVWLEQ